jgi:uncharacterized membrane protein
MNDVDLHLWAKLHGAATHFPIALSLASVAFEIAGWAARGRPARDELRAAAKFSLWLAAAASLPAVASGLVMTRGRLLGHDLLRMHHLLVWPAFALLIANATWRLSIGARASPRALGWYRASVVVAAGLTAAAGAWGGEMLLSR